MVLSVCTLFIYLKTHFNPTLTSFFKFRIDIFSHFKTMKKNIIQFPSKTCSTCFTCTILQLPVLTGVVI